MQSDWGYPVVKKGMFARFFHPGTLGLMLDGYVKEVEEDRVLVKFVDAHPNGKREFWVPHDNLKCRGAK